MTYCLRENFIKICIDTNCDMLFIDRKYLLKTRFEINIQKIKKSIRVRDINDKLHDSSEYAICYERTSRHIHRSSIQTSSQNFVEFRIDEVNEVIKCTSRFAYHET